MNKDIHKKIFDLKKPGFFSNQPMMMNVNDNDSSDDSDSEDSGRFKDNYDKAYIDKIVP